MTRAYPILYGRDSKGRIKVWITEVYVGSKIDALPVIIVRHGLQGGNLQTDRTVVSEGKNIGRSNQTTPFKQALKEANSKWNKKQLAGKYAQTIEEYDTYTGPKAMLALSAVWPKQADKMEMPCLEQPKLDGIRTSAVIGYDAVLFFSRNGIPKQYPHLIKPLLAIFEPGQTVDGEIYKHGMELQDIVSGSSGNEKTGQLEYHVYDLNVEGVAQGWRTRRLGLYMSLAPKDSPVKLVPSTLVNNAEECNAALRKHLAEGYEGAILRGVKGEYKAGFRSDQVQKMKPIMEEEFRIIGAKEGKGRDEGAVIWRCEVKPGLEFDVVPNGTMEARRAWWVNRTAMIKGKLMLTCRFANYTPDGIPFHAKGIVIRDYE